MIGGPSCLDGLLEAVLEVAAQRRWIRYERGWADAQKQSTNRKSGHLLALWQASASEEDLELFGAHAVPAVRISFNPLLGTGGNAGKRDFSDGWRRAVHALEQDPPTRALKRSELKCLLQGEPVTWMVEKLNAASWFSDANKLYNSGQRAYREGAISPWAMVLACEGLVFFAGGASRRFGSRTRVVGAFPFVTRPAAPCGPGEAGQDLAEVWVPIWDRPMTVPEIVTLFSRGRAEAGGHGALTPGAFATAVVRRGVDAGITEFRRFVLARTTSANTFEPRFHGTFPIGSRGPGTRSTNGASAAMNRLLALIDQFRRGPLADRKEGNRWRYVGLSGSIERGMLRVAQSPDDPDAAGAVLDAVVGVLDRIDRNSSFRARRVAWTPLPQEWLITLFNAEPPSAEARLALAVASSFPATRPLALYRFGVEFNGHRFMHPPEGPKQWVWRPDLPLPEALAKVLHRRTLDWDSDRCTDPVRSGVPVPGADVERWFAGVVDHELLVRWISRLALFDWADVRPGLRSLATRNHHVVEARGRLYLFGLFQPLFDLLPVIVSTQQKLDLMPLETGARTPAAARRLLGLLRAGDVGGAVRFAGTRYAMGAKRLAKYGIEWPWCEVDDLMASFLFPICDYERSLLIGRWLRPTREPGEENVI